MELDARAPLETWKQTRKRQTSCCVICFERTREQTLGERERGREREIRQSGCRFSGIRAEEERITFHSEILRLLVRVSLTSDGDGSSGGVASLSPSVSLCLVSSSHVHSVRRSFASLPLVPLLLLFSASGSKDPLPLAVLVRRLMRCSLPLSLAWETDFSFLLPCIRKSASSSPDRASHALATIRVALGS